MANASGYMSAQQHLRRSRRTIFQMSHCRKDYRFKLLSPVLILRRIRNVMLKSSVIDAA